MKLRFGDPRLGELELDARFDGGYSGDIVRAFRKRIQQIRDAEDERTLRAYKSLRFEKLKGNRSHQYSLRLNDQYRLIIDIVGKSPDKTIVVMQIEDYH